MSLDFDFLCCFLFFFLNSPFVGSYWFTWVLSVVVDIEMKRVDKGREEREAFCLQWFCNGGPSSKL